MYRTGWIIGLGVACLVMAAIAALLSFRIITAEPWRGADVLGVMFLAIALVIFGSVYWGRRGTA
jgi:hypothetical protein